MPLTPEMVWRAPQQHHPEIRLITFQNRRHFEQATAFAKSTNPVYFTPMNRRWPQASEQLMGGAQ